MRSLAIIMIVLSHLYSIFLDPGAHNFLLFAISGFISFVGIGIFCFISGFGLYNKNKENLDLRNFYKKRILRIYPLYWLAIFATDLHDYFLPPIVHFTVPAVTPHIFAITFVGLQGFVPAFKGVFWFIGAILIYYSLYPLLISPKTNSGIIILNLMVFAMLFIGVMVQIVHIKVWIYFLAFASGIATNRMLDELKNIRNLSIIVATVFILSSLMCLLLSLISSKVQDQILAPYIANPIFLFIVVLYNIGVSLIAVCGSILTFKGIQIHPVSNDVINKISFSSFALYLFHGLFIGTVIQILYDLKLNILLIIFVLPSIFILCYLIQKIASKFDNKLRIYI